MKSQSAMEYLMTYGWAILIIAVILGVLFDIGIFSLPNFGSSCLAQSGFLCTNPILANTGALSVVFGQVSGSPITVTGVACTNSSVAPNFFNTTFLNLYPGEEQQVIFPCPTTSSDIGTIFKGDLWIQYNFGQQTNLVAQVASVSVTASIVQSLYITDYNAWTNPYIELSILNTQNNQLSSVSYSTYATTIITISKTMAYIFDLSSLVLFNRQSQQFVTAGNGFSSIILSPNGQIYAASASGNTISAFQMESNSWVGNIIIAQQNPQYLATSPNGTILYAANQISLYSINAQTGATINVIDLSNYGDVNPTDMAITPNGAYVYVTYASPSNVLIVNTTTYQLNTIPLGNVGCVGPVTFSPNSAYAFVSLGCNGGLSIINTTTKSLLSGTYNTWCTGNPIFVPYKNIAYFPCGNGGNIDVLNLSELASGQYSATPINLGQNAGPFYNGAIDSNGKYLYLIGSSYLYVVKTSNNQVVAVILGLNQPKYAAFAPP